MESSMDVSSFTFLEGNGGAGKMLVSTRTHATLSKPSNTGHAGSGVKYGHAGSGFKYGMLLSITLPLSLALRLFTRRKTRAATARPQETGKTTIESFSEQVPVVERAASLCTNEAGSSQCAASNHIVTQASDDLSLKSFAMPGADGGHGQLMCSMTGMHDLLSKHPSVNGLAAVAQSEPLTENQSIDAIEISLEEQPLGPFAALTNENGLRSELEESLSEVSTNGTEPVLASQHSARSARGRTESVFKKLIPPANSVKILREYTNPLPQLPTTASKWPIDGNNVGGINLNDMPYHLAPSQWLKLLESCPTRSLITIGPHSLSTTGCGSDKAVKVIQSKKLSFVHNPSVPTSVLVAIHGPCLNAVLARMTHLSLSLESSSLWRQLPLEQLARLTSLTLSPAEESFLTRSNTPISEQLPDLSPVAALASLRSLTLKGFIARDADSTTQLSLLPQLHTLVLEECQLQASSLEYLSSLTKLSCLVVQNCSQPNGSTYTLSEPHLEVLSHMPALSSLSASALSSTVPPLSAACSITSLVVDGPVCGEGLSINTHFPNATLAKLSLCVGGDTLHSFLQGATRLTSLTLTRSQGAAPSGLTASASTPAAAGTGFRALGADLDPAEVASPTAADATNGGGRTLLAGIQGYELMLSTYGIAMASALSLCHNLQEVCIHGVQDLQLLQHLAAGLSESRHLRRLEFRQCLSSPRTLEPPPTLEKSPSLAMQRSPATPARPRATSISLGVVRVSSVMRHLVQTPVQVLVVDGCGGLFEGVLPTGGLATAPSPSLGNPPRTPLRTMASMSEATRRTAGAGDFIKVGAGSAGGIAPVGTPEATVLQNWVSEGGSSLSSRPSVDSAKPSQPPEFAWAKNASEASTRDWAKGREVLPFLIRPWPSLVSLTLASMEELGDAEVAAICAAHPNLRKVSVLHCPRVTPALVKALLTRQGIHGVEVV